MKKIVVRLLIALVVVFLLAVLAVGLFLDGAIKKGVETLGPRLTKVDIKLQSVGLSLLSGSGTVKGLVIGNPEGFQAPSAIRVGTATLSLKPGSLLSDKIIIKTINVEGPEITFETDLRRNNLSKLLANVQAAMGSGQPEPAKPQEPGQKAAKPAKKLQVDEFVITGGKIHVSLTGLAAGTATVPLPAIRLENLGAGPEGITPAELTKKVLTAVEQGTVQAAAGTVTDISKGALNLGTSLGSSLSTNALQKVTKGIGGLFKK